jgi:hypothetical protein
MGSENQVNSLSSGMNLLDFDQGTFCKVIEQLQPIQIQFLTKLLSLSKESANRIPDCVTEIDFTNGEPLLTEAGFVNDTVLSSKNWSSVISKYHRLKQYRIGFKTSFEPNLTDEGDIDEYIDRHLDDHLDRTNSQRFSSVDDDDEIESELSEWKRIVEDVRARWVALKNYAQDDNIPELINNGLRKRVKKYGSDFTFVSQSKYGFSYHNGTMILFDNPFLNERTDEFAKQLEAYDELMFEFKGLIHTLGAGDVRIIEKFLSSPETYPNITKIVMIDHGVAPDGNVFSHINVMGTLRPFLPRLTEIDFQVFQGLALEDYDEFPTYREDSLNYYRELLEEKKRNPELSFPNITKFDIPIPTRMTQKFQRIFPNVKRFYYSEEYNYTRQTLELLRDLGKVGITEIRQKI